MLKRTLVGLVMTTWLVAGGAQAEAASILYGADGSGGNPSNLYVIDPSSGAVITTIGAIGFAVTGLAIDPTTGVMFGSTGGAGAIPPSLITIDLTTGAGTLVGALDGVLADITFDPLGNLYGWLEPSSDDLVSVDKTTGQITIVGDSGLSTALTGLAMGPGGTLYFGGFNDLNLVGLVSIDPATGAVTGDVAYAGFELVGMGLAFDESGVLFGIEQLGSAGRNLVRIDPVTGAVTIIGGTVDRLDALAFQTIVPEPGALALLVIGAVAVRRSRQRAG